MQVPLKHNLLYTYGSLCASLFLLHLKDTHIINYFYSTEIIITSGCEAIELTTASLCCLSVSSVNTMSIDVLTEKKRGRELQLLIINLCIA